MKEDRIQAAIDEAMRFVERAVRLQEQLSKIPPEQRPLALQVGSPATGAVRRSSLDLTRALADLRRSV